METETKQVLPDVSQIIHATNNAVYVDASSLIAMISESYMHMEKLHRRQIVTLKQKFIQESKISRSDHKVIYATFKKYKEELTKPDGKKATEPDPLKPFDDYVKRLNYALLEAEAIEQAAEGLMAQLRNSGGNFEVRKRA